MAQTPVGIDLGSNYACVGVWQNERAEVIANEQGNRSTPCIVSFDDTESIVGDAAFAQIHKNPKNTVYGVKSLLGKSFGDEETQKVIKAFPFTVEEGDAGVPQICVDLQEKRMCYSPSQIASMILKDVKESAEKFTGQKVKQVVLAVPASFDEAQRAAVMEAGTGAGLEVLRIISEPAAAAIAFGLDIVENKENGVFVVFDFGGSTLDVTVLEIENGLMTVVETATNNSIGGDIVDTLLLEHFAKEFQRKYKSDMRDSKKAMRKLRTECENAKKMLSKAAQASVDLDGLYEGLDFNSRVSKARFEDMIGSVVKQATDTVNETLAKAGIPAEAVKKVLMVGGSSRLKKVHSKLEGIFGKGKLVVVDTINPEEAVAIGATAQASILMASNTAASGGESPKKGNDKKEEPPAVPVVTKVQVVPLSLGLRSADGTMAVVIARGSTLPAKATVQCSTSTDNQESVELQLYEGERAMADDNFLLAKFVLGGVPPMPRGLPHIDVTFTVDEQGQLGVEAVADGKDKKAVLSVHADKERLPAAEVQKLVMEAAAHAAADDSKNKLVARAKELGGFLRTAKLITTDATALQVVTDAEEWLARGESTLEEMDNKQAEVELAQEAALDAEPAFDPDDIELDMDDDDDMD